MEKMRAVFVKDEIYDPGVNLIEDDESLNNKKCYSSDSSDSDSECVRIFNDTGPSSSCEGLSGTKRSGGAHTKLPNGLTECDICKKQTGCPLRRPFNCAHDFCDNCYSSTREEKCPLCGSDRRAAAGRCEAVYPSPGHSNAGPFSSIKRSYKCGLSRRNPRGFIFCQACSRADVCPMCKSPLTH